jgi:hypothetical protein
MAGNINSKTFNIPGFETFDGEEKYISAERAKQINVKLGHLAIFKPNDKF